ncbi:MAG: hypothetical protein AW12_01303 [Candidatus Accumulibacter sp. BA-94]|nr:MAG: hypothetical protein AW12_01303 [Candidatus Accumulibacter sp. BA-94]
MAILVGRRLQATEVDLAGLDLVQDAVDRQFVAVAQVDRPVDLGLAGEQGADLEVVAREPADPVKGDDVVDVGDRHRQALIGGVVVERHA